MLDKVERIAERYEELNHLMADPAMVTDYVQVATYAQEQAEIKELVEAYRRYRSLEVELANTKALLDTEEDEEMRELAGQEVARIDEEMEALTEQMRRLLLPKDPNDEKNVIVEVRAGAGGDEAGLFAADLCRMYTRYAEAQRWKTEILSAHETGVKGYKEVIFEVRGRGAYSRLKFESGVHRVQRVPTTEAAGRIHTSTATVAVLPEAEEVEIQIDPGDLSIDNYGSSGPGGQHMQKNMTAVRITHKPTGMVVSCESERSQTQNRERAMAVLRARLYEAERQRLASERGEERRLQVGSGERSEKIRTYNFPQNRVTDHRIGLTLYHLEQIMNGDLDEVIDELATTEQAERLQAIGSDSNGDD
ncbi:MAG TPA: peptide chain release factor 1 [Anaerolineae bacterium]|nr:peptide chain release factor 1 [Anaerolineae bacterium]